MTDIILLTAERGAGKSTALWRAIAQLRQEGLHLGGILAPARYDAADSKCGIDVIDLTAQERRALAVVVQGEGEHTVGQYHFASEVMDWSLERLLYALGEPLDLVVIDEVGPLELNQRRGFAPALAQLTNTAASCVLIVVRIELVERLASELADHDQSVIHLTHENRDAIPAQLVAEIRRRTAQD